MSLIKLNNIYIDIAKISYIGDFDTHIEHSVQLNRILHFFLVVVDGYPIEIKASTKDQLKEIRDQLLLNCEHF
jgi:hypothetical protein